MIKQSCNWIGWEEQLASSNQEVVLNATFAWCLPQCKKSKRLLNFCPEILMIKESHNLIGREKKNLKDQLISSRNIDDQRTLQSDWLAGSISGHNRRTRYFTDIGFSRIIKNNVMHHFMVTKRHINGLHFWQKLKKIFLRGIFGLFLQNEDFSEKFSSVSFWFLRP